MVDDGAGREFGGVAAARDRQIGRALKAIHRRHGETWTVESPATRAGMSRSAFAARFTELVGAPDLRYVTAWRMRLARAQLLETRRTIGDVAADLGYASEQAFSRAVKRVFGTPPGVLRRREARQTQRPPGPLA